MDIGNNQFTRAEKKIADYIKKNADHILYLPITDLASRIGVSETSIFRFCKTLGYDGYQEMKVSLAKSLSIENNIREQPVDLKVTKEDSIKTMARKLYAANTNALKQTVEVLDYDRVEQAVEWMTKAESIGFFGIGSSNITATEARRKFSRVRKNVVHTPDAHDQMITASVLGSGDLAVVFSYSGATKDILDILLILRERRVPIILITRYASSAATEYADIVLLCGSVEGIFTGDSMSNKISQLFTVDILHGAYYRSNYQEARANKTRGLEAISSRIFFAD